ncbi:hypothetical protein EVJ58_g2933, partial [Rhodofomes roseus]
LNRPQTRVPGVRFVADGVDRLKLGEDVFQTQDDIVRLPPPEPAEKDPVSPRASPRSTSAEVLEEFLSILQSSSFRFQPTSPILRTNNGSASHTFYYRASSSLGGSHPDGLGLSSLGETADEMRKDSATPAYPFKLIGSGSLGSYKFFRCWSLPEADHLTLADAPHAIVHLYVFSVACVAHAHAQPLPAPPILRERHRWHFPSALRVTWAAVPGLTCHSLHVPGSGSPAPAHPPTS